MTPRVRLLLIAVLAIACVGAALARPAPLPGVPVATTVPVLVADALVPPLDVALEDDDDRAHAEPHGEQLCASGCALSRHPTPVLERARYAALVRDFAAEPLTGGPALDSLLFHGVQTRAWRQSERQSEIAPALDARRAALLDGELARDHVTVELRIVDASGRRRVYVPPTRVPLDVRQVFHPDHVGLQRLELSGTVKRVGLGHLWQRL